eukprot:gene14166-5169_t
MASMTNTRQWRSTSTKLRSIEFAAIKKDCNAEDLELPKRTSVKNERLKGRKLLRKERRLQTKANQHVSWMKKRGIDIKPAEEEKKKKKRVQKRKKKKKKKEENEDDKVKDNEQIDTDALVAANEQEDKLIARLEKKLGLKKRKNLPSKFKEDGFDYLLELCEPIDNPALFLSDEDEGGLKDDIVHNKAEDSESEPETKASKRKQRKENMGKPAANTKEKENKLKIQDKDEDGKDSELDEEDSDDEYLDENDSMSESNFSTEDLDNEESESEGVAVQGLKSNADSKDLYGKIVNSHKNVLTSELGEEDSRRLGQDENKKTGDVVEPSAKYVPPHLRKMIGKSKSTDEQRIERLKKKLKGLVNRLSDSNMRSIALEIEEVYATNSRNDTNSVLSNLVFDACVTPTHMSEKILMEHMMLVAILHTVVGNEVGAFFVQSLAEMFHGLHSTTEKYLNGKECDNALLLIAHLYNFSVIDSLLVYDLIRELVNAFTERDIEMLMLLLKAVGAEIRRDDPGSLKEIILEIQAKAASCTDLMKQSRVRFMLDVITALRNNNLRKIPQYDPAVSEHARKKLKAMLKNKGRWWVVGSAWAGRESDPNLDVTAKDSRQDIGENNLVSLAKQQRMNTEIRKKIFYVIMSSEDYIDCFEKLLKLNLKDKQAREIVHVLIDCCVQEKIYNPYYAFLAQKLCEFSRSNQVTFQYSFWDRFKQISASSPHNLENLAKLLAHLFASSALSMSILKVVGFATIDKSSVRFFMRLFTVLLTEYPESTMRNVFSRISPLSKLSLLREGLKLFLKHFLLSKNTTKLEGKVIAPGRLKELVEIAEAALDGREVVKF